MNSKMIYEKLEGTNYRKEGDKNILFDHFLIFEDFMKKEYSF